LNPFCQRLQNLHSAILHCLSEGRKNENQKRLPVSYYSLTDYLNALAIKTIVKARCVVQAKTGGWGSGGQPGQKSTKGNCLKNKIKKGLQTRLA
jgi:hypothetical protein